MLRQILAYGAIGGFVSGIAFRSFFDVGVLAWLIPILCAMVLALYLLVRSINGLSHQVLMLLVVLTGAGLGVLRMDLALQHNGSPLLERHIGQRVVFEGVITDEPDVRETHTNLTVDINTFAGARLPAITRALVSVRPYPKFNYGDHIRVQGALQKPANFSASAEDSREFNYVGYLSKDSIYYLVKYPTVTVQGTGGGNVIKRYLFAIKHAFLRNISAVIPEPYASLAGGLIVGAKATLGKSLEDDFRRAGIIHIVVLSGYNLTIIAGAVERLLVFLPLAASLSISSVLIVLFTLMTGASATIVRAAIMSLVVLLARATGRPHTVTTALFFAGAAMLAHNPKILMYDPSFQLSFLATIALLYVAPHVERLLQWVPKVSGFREFATATISTQIFVLPFLLYQIGDLSLVALPVNLLVLMFIPITMLVSFLAGLIGFASTLVALPVAFVAYWLLWYEISVVEFFSHLPLSSIHIQYFPAWLMFLCYGAFVVLFIELWKRNSRRAAGTKKPARE